MPDADVFDQMARTLFQKALDENRAGELLAHLFDGDGVTIDARTGEFVFIPESVIDGFISKSVADELKYRCAFCMEFATDDVAALEAHWLECQAKRVNDAWDTLGIE